jgi:hypothetical protein
VRNTLILLSAALAFTSAPVRASDDEFVVEPNAVVTASINGRPARMLFRGVGSSVPILNPQSANTFDIKPAFIRSGISFQIGPVRVNGRNGVARYDIGGRKQKRRVGWFEREIAPGYDGLLGPMAIAHSVVTMRLRAQRPGEQVVTLGLSTFGYLGGGVVLRSSPLTILQFDPISPTTIANAPFANELAGPLRAFFVGDVRPRLIALGVSRPVRTLQFGAPLSFGAFKIAQTDVRMQDWGRTDTIPDVAPDPDEIIVSALDKNDKRLRFIIAGADALSNCSSITYDKPKRQIRLSCLPS